MERKIAILGSTGSIGTQTLEIVRRNGDIRVTALAAGRNIECLEAQIREFSPELACEYLETQRILLIVPKNHALYYEMNQTNYAVLSIDDMHKLNNEPFILLSPSEGMRMVSDHFFQTYHITPNVIMEVQDTATAYSLSVSGLGLTLISDLRVLLKMPNMLVSDYCCYQLGNPPYTRTRVVAYLKNAVLTSSEEYFISLSKENIKNLYMHAKQF